MTATPNTSALQALLERVAHDGGPMPVLGHVIVRPEYRGPERPEIGTRIVCARAARLDWSHDGGPDDIVGYTAIGIAAPVAENEAACDATAVQPQ